MVRVTIWSHLKRYINKLDNITVHLFSFSSTGKIRRAFGSRLPRTFRMDLPIYQWLQESIHWMLSMNLSLATSNTVGVKYVCVNMHLLSKAFQSKGDMNVCRNRLTCRLQPMFSGSFPLLVFGLIKSLGELDHAVLWPSATANSLDWFSKQEQTFTGGTYHFCSFRVYV